MSRVIVYHGFHGCDTGCCGHIVELEDSGERSFSFDHPDSLIDDETREWVKDLVTEQFGPEHVADIDWAQVLVSTD